MESEDAVLAGRCLAHGRPIPPEHLGELTDSAHLAGTPGALAAQLADDGYLFVRGAVPLEATLAARRGVLGRLAEVDEVEEVDGTARATGRSRRLELAPDKGAFWQAVSEQAAMRAVTHGPALRALASEVLDSPARPFDFVFLRPGVAGRYTNIHCDKPFFTRKTARVLTFWIALGEIPVERGPLFVVEGSHRWPDVKQAVADYDVGRDSGRRNSVVDHPADYAAARGTRLLTADFQPGDVVVFGMYLLHGAFDNHAGDGAIRLSCDVRFQPQQDAIDPRYFGASPTGTTGAGYGELNGAKPLTEAWHQR